MDNYDLYALAGAFTGAVIGSTYMYYKSKEIQNALINNIRKELYGINNKSSLEKSLEDSDSIN